MRLLAALLALLLLTSIANADSLEDGLIAFNAKDYATAYDLLLPLAEQGDPEAQRLVGVMYRKGLGREIDYAQALQWLEKAANQGNRRAVVSLGLMYVEGTGVEKDEERGLALFTEAATACEPDAAGLLGAYYMLVAPPLKNIPLGIGWLIVADQLAADIGSEALTIALTLQDPADIAKGKALAPQLKASVHCSS